MLYSYRNDLFQNIVYSKSKSKSAIRSNLNFNAKNHHLSFNCMTNFSNLSILLSKMTGIIMFIFSAKIQACRVGPPGYFQRSFRPCCLTQIWPRKVNYFWKLHKCFETKAQRKKGSKTEHQKRFQRIAMLDFSAKWTNLLHTVPTNRSIGRIYGLTPATLGVSHAPQKWFCTIWEKLVLYFHPYQSNQSSNRTKPTKTKMSENVTEVVKIWNL